MSDEQDVPTHIHETEYPSEVRVPYSFIVTDAALSAFLTEMGAKMRFQSRWHQTSSGSSSYALTTETKQKLGEIVVRALGEQETYIKESTKSPLPDYLPWLLARFMWWMVGDLLAVQIRALPGPISPAPPGPAPALPEKPQKPRGAGQERFNREAAKRLHVEKIEKPYSGSGRARKTTTYLTQKSARRQIMHLDACFPESLKLVM
jgi:hypothetical protein